MKKKVLAIILTIVMVVTLLPTLVFAETVENEEHKINVITENGTIQVIRNKLSNNLERIDLIAIPSEGYNLTSITATPDKCSEEIDISDMNGLSFVLNSSMLQENENIDIHATFSKFDVEKTFIVEWTGNGSVNNQSKITPEISENKLKFTFEANTTIPTDLEFYLSPEENNSISALPSKVSYSFLLGNVLKVN